MVLGPPRSGKTSSVIIPNVLAANGPVVTTSTKPDILDATVGARSLTGTCSVFDPTGARGADARVGRLCWSPLQRCNHWDGAQAVARRTVTTSAAGRAGGWDHWTERAAALVAPLLHAAALDGAPLRTALSWIDRRQALPAQQILAAASGTDASLASDLLAGLVRTDDRELSGIWSTASGAFAGYRSEAALSSADRPTFDADAFVRSGDTIYVTSPADRQALVAPMVVGLVDDVRAATYRHAAVEPGGVPVLLALDEVANIAPLPDLPGLVSEGGGQGVATLACLQDLSQARARWGPAADGFASLFGTTLVLPGIGDVATLSALSALAGDEEVVARSQSSTRLPTGRPVTDLVTGGRSQVSATVSTTWRPRLPVDVITRGSPGHALAFGADNVATWVPLAAAHREEPWRTLTRSERVRAIDGRGVPQVRTR